MTALLCTLNLCAYMLVETLYTEKWLGMVEYLRPFSLIVLLKIIYDAYILADINSGKINLKLAGNVWIVFVVFFSYSTISTLGLLNALWSVGIGYFVMIFTTIFFQHKEKRDPLGFHVFIAAVFLATYLFYLNSVPAINMFSMISAELIVPILLYLAGIPMLARHHEQLLRLISKWKYCCSRTALATLSQWQTSSTPSVCPRKLWLSWFTWMWFPLGHELLKTQTLFFLSQEFDRRMVSRVLRAYTTMLMRFFPTQLAKRPFIYRDRHKSERQLRRS